METSKFPCSPPHWSALALALFSKVIPVWVLVSTHPVAPQDCFLQWVQEQESLRSVGEQSIMYLKEGLRGHTTVSS